MMCGVIRPLSLGSSVAMYMNEDTTSVSKSAAHDQKSSISLGCHIDLDEGTTDGRLDEGITR
jgi:hypothetical protein